mgnify:CR=1 FL=1
MVGGGKCWGCGRKGGSGGGGFTRVGTSVACGDVAEACGRWPRRRWLSDGGGWGGAPIEVLRGRRTAQLGERRRERRYLLESDPGHP